jgi:alpha-1,6-mannosyltransferase
VAGPTLPYDPTYHLLGRFDKIRGRVRAEQPDIVEAHSPYLATAAVLACGRVAPVLACGRAAPVRTAFWHADHVGTYVQPALSRVLGERAGASASRPLWRAMRALLSPFDAVFVGGRAQAERLRDAGVPGVMHVPFGVDTKTFRPRALPPPGEARPGLPPDLPPGCAVLVAVGRFAIEKRWDVVLDAVDRLRTRRPAVLLLFGDGPDRPALERRAGASPYVRFMGFVKDRELLARALASADVLVHGCPYETYGLGVAEAIACGLPVVVPDRGGAAESVDPSAGETYRSLDPAACAAAIERLLARDPAELRAKAIAAASRVPTQEAHFGAVLSAYDALLSEGPSLK